MRKLNDGIEPLATQIMTLLLGLLQSTKVSTVHEDTFLVVGTMAEGMPLNWTKRSVH